MSHGDSGPPPRSGPSSSSGGGDGPPRPRPQLSQSQSSSRQRPSGPPPASSSGSRHRLPPPITAGLHPPGERPSGPRAASSGLLPPGGLGMALGRPQSNVGARLLKKRQSVSYHTAVTEGMAGGPRGAPPPMPGMGSVPAALVPGGGQGGVGVRMGMPVPRAANQADDDLGRTGLDIDLLASEGFKPEDLLKQNINPSRAGEAHMDDLKRLRSRLEGAMKITEAELQKSVFKNYADFVIISKEIATLENEMLELKGVLEEWRAVPESLEGGWGDDDLLIGGSSAPNRRTQRNSLADLATLYKSQLSALWEGVEGAQKFLPYVPGRHVISESASFVELHAATYKPKQQVHLFLLNDAMLVASKKRRGTAANAMRLVAERCFNLSEIVVVDLKDGGELNNAVKIKRGKETIIFRTEKSEDKKVLLLAFKKVAEELMNKKRKDMLSEAEARKGDPNAPRGSRQDYDGFSSPAGFSPVEILGLTTKDDSTGKDLSWIGDFSDELSVAIATRTFEQAVEMIEKGKSIVQPLASSAHASHLFRAKLDQRTAELVTALLNDLSDPSIRKSGVSRTTSWLLRLGQGERARETFLTGRGNLVRRRARQIKFEGDISMYISELAMVCFTLIKNTCEWYMAAFKDNRMASGFVRWASEQVEVYAETFRRQVYGADQDKAVIEESLEVTKSHGAMLRDVGLDFTFLLDGLLRPQEKPAAAAVPRAVGHLRPGKGSQSAVAQARHSVFLMRGDDKGGLGLGVGGEGGGSGGR